MPKQVSKDNGVIPMQLQKKELEGILDQAQRYLPFLTEKDETGLTVREKSFPFASTVFRTMLAR